MILSKNNKQTNKKQKQNVAKKSRHGVTGLGGIGNGKEGHFGGFWNANCYIWNGWAVGSYCTAQGNVYDWVICCTTELDETL